MHTDKSDAKIPKPVAPTNVLPGCFVRQDCIPLQFALDIFVGRVDINKLHRFFCKDDDMLFTMHFTDDKMDPKCRYIRTFNSMVCNDEFISDICDNFKACRVMDIMDGSDCTDKTIDYVCRELRHLEHLSIRQIQNITPMVLSTIAEKLPKLKTICLVGETTFSRKDFNEFVIQKLPELLFANITVKS